MRSPSAETVVKVGGALLSRPDALDRVVRAIGNTEAKGRHVLVVPGGGPFADVVRDIDRRVGLDASTAHWMAILGMEQYAYLLASRIANACLVERPSEFPSVFRANRVPILAPFHWLREQDPLPHTWDVTSDSIAAWIAGEVGARRLILVKPVVGHSTTLVDPYFERVVPKQVRTVIADADGLTGAFREG